MIGWSGAERSAPLFSGAPASLWRTQFEELDVVMYSLEKAMRLLLKSNPNIVGLLWLRDEEYVHRHPIFALLHAQREIFSSQVAADAFSGYAMDQLQRMEAFDLERMAEYESLTTEIRARGPLTEVLEADANKLVHIAANWGIELDALKRFRKLHRSHFSGYMGEKRKAMVRRYQYDVKNAAHLIRPLRMGTEFLRTGRLAVYRTADADELKVTKRGGWTPINGFSVCSRCTRPMRIALNVAGFFCLLIGCVWMLQGINILPAAS